MFVLSSDILIGKFRFSGVHQVTISKSVHSIVQKAEIKVPSTARVLNRANEQPENVVTGKQFSVGDEVIIKLGYNSELEEEFRGFVTSVGKDAPLVVTCEGYNWLLHHNRVSGFYKRISLAELLQKAVGGLPGGHRIKVSCKADILFSNIILNNNTGAEVLKLINDYTDGALSCYFVSPDELWCGFLHSGTVIKPEVKYKLGYNTIRGNDLATRNTSKAETAVVYSKRLSDGSVIVKGSDNSKKAQTQSKKTLNHIANSASLKMLANGKAERINYGGFEGSITTLLQPYVLVGEMVSLIDTRDSTRDGYYIVERHDDNLWH